VEHIPPDIVNFNSLSSFKRSIQLVNFSGFLINVFKFLTIMYFSFLLWASTSAAIQPGLSSSNVLCFIAIVAILSFQQINHCHCHCLGWQHFMALRGIVKLVSATGLSNNNNWRWYCVLQIDSIGRVFRCRKDGRWSRCCIHYMKQVPYQDILAMMTTPTFTVHDK